MDGLSRSRAAPTFWGSWRRCVLPPRSIRSTANWACLLLLVVWACAWLCLTLPGRRVLLATKARRQLLLDKFQQFLGNVPGSQSVEGAGPAAFAPAEFGRDLYNAGNSCNNCAETINALVSVGWPLRRRLGLVSARGFADVACGPVVSRVACLRWC